ncbi:Efflux pump mlcE, partial [Lachnellula suecica]
MATKEQGRGAAAAADALETPHGELSTDGIPNSSFLTGLKLYQVVIGLSVSYFLILLNSTIVVTAIPSITKDFNSIEDIGWYGSAYLLANCSLQPLSGKIYTYHSLKYTFLVFLAVFELGSLLCGVSTSSNMLIVGRAVAGSGASGILNGSMTILSACAPPKQRPYLVGGAISFGALGQVMGPLIGGLLTQHVTWRWGFYINLPLGGATAVLILFTRIPDQRKKVKGSTWKNTLQQLDLFGFATFAPSVIMLLLALNWGGNKYSWNSATIIGLFCGAFGIFCVFLGWENHKEDDAMVPLHLLSRRIIASCYLTGFFQAGAIVEMTYYLPLWFQSAKRDTPTISGVDILPTVGSQILFAAVTGVVVSKTGWTTPLAMAGSALLAIGSGLLTTLTPSTIAGKWAGYQILTGAGRGIVQQIPIVIVQAVLTGDEIAVGSSLLAFTQYMGGAVFLSAATTLFNSGLVTSLKNYAPQVNATAIISAGATGVADAVSESDLQDVLLAYSKAITQTFVSSLWLSLG